MDYTVLGIIIIAVSALILTFVALKKKNVSKEVETAAHDNTLFATSDNNLPGLQIQLEMLPIEMLPDNKKLMEITDHRLLAHINNVVPELAQIGNVVNNTVQAVRSDGEVLYRAIIPAGAKLAESKSMANAVRGMYHGENGIKGHANFMKVEVQNGTVIATNAAASVMGVASMVVGQYYMEQINTALDEIKEGISKVSEFQDNEYNSRVAALVANVRKIADFQAEILGNDELRFSKITQIDNLEHECIQLLGQANGTLSGYTTQQNLNYDEYVKEIAKAHVWFMYQKALMDVLCKIAELKYALHLGVASREYCNATLPMYSKQVIEVQNRLSEWHQNTTQRLKIDTTEIRRKRVGLDGAVHFVPGLFKNDFNFKEIEKDIVKMIIVQSADIGVENEIDTSERFEEDVQLIAKDGKIYYLTDNILC